MERAKDPKMWGAAAQTHLENVKPRLDSIDCGSNIKEKISIRVVYGAFCILTKDQVQSIDLQPSNG